LEGEEGRGKWRAEGGKEERMRTRYKKRKSLGARNQEGGNFGKDSEAIGEEDKRKKVTLKGNLFNKSRQTLRKSNWVLQSINPIMTSHRSLIRSSIVSSTGSHVVPNKKTI
jgi:hypothetical protein